VGFSLSRALCCLWLELDNPFWAGTSAAIIRQPQLAASLRNGWFRTIGDSCRRCDERGSGSVLPARSCAVSRKSRIVGGGLRRDRACAGDWEGLVHSRLSAMPEEAPLQRAEMLAALSVGSEIIQLRRIVHRLGLSADLDPALAAGAQSNSASAIAHLAHLDAPFATRGGAGPLMQTVLRSRGSFSYYPEALTQHVSYFDGRATHEVHRN
jgi:hypothetical protein